MFISINVIGFTVHYTDIQMSSYYNIDIFQ